MDRGDGAVAWLPESDRKDLATQALSARVEATMSSWKQMIGDELRAHSDERRATEVAVAMHVLNRMLDLRRPSCVRIA